MEQQLLNRLRFCCRWGEIIWACHSSMKGISLRIMPLKTATNSRLLRWGLISAQPSKPDFCHGNSSWRIRVVCLYFAWGAFQPPATSKPNNRLQNLLSFQVEAFVLWNWLKGGPARRQSLEQAWKYLLLNHPHDSICGCSIDEVHDMPRFR